MTTLKQHLPTIKCEGLANFGTCQSLNEGTAKVQRLITDAEQQDDVTDVY